MFRTIVSIVVLIKTAQYSITYLFEYCAKTQVLHNIFEFKKYAKTENYVAIIDTN